LGAESRIADHTLTGVAAGGGLRYLFTKHIGADVDYKHIYFGEARHDNLVSLSINFMFGVKEKQAAKVEPLPEPVAEVAVVKEEPVAEPAVKNKEPEAMVVLAPVDTDGDGVFDEYDKCPDTMTGTVVNADGCFKSMKLEVYFKTNSDEIDTASMHKVEAFAAFLKRNSVLNVEIQGHTDSRGDENYNLDLSRRRAASVSAALSDKFGIEKNRLSSKGYGETAPVATNETPEGRALNRRIEAVAVDDAGGVVESQKK
jgi:OOP family OmpA-OmpF porin